MGFSHPPNLNQRLRERMRTHIKHTLTAFKPEASKIDKSRKVIYFLNANSESKLQRSYQAFSENNLFNIKTVLNVISIFCLHLIELKLQIMSLTYSYKFKVLK